MNPVFCYRAVVRSVYDGDTIRVDIDLGLDTWVHNVPLRLYGIDTPEMRGEERPEGVKVRDYVRERIHNANKVTVETIKDRKGKYGRWLAIVWLDDENLNQTLVRTGRARPYIP